MISSDHIRVDYEDMSNLITMSIKWFKFTKPKYEIKTLLAAAGMM